MSMLWGVIVFLVIGGIFGMLVGLLYSWMDEEKDR